MKAILLLNVIVLVIIIGRYSFPKVILYFLKGVLFISLIALAAYMIHTNGTDIQGLLSSLLEIFKGVFGDL